MSDSDKTVVSECDLLAWEAEQRHEAIDLVMAMWLRGHPGARPSTTMIADVDGLTVPRLVRTRFAAAVAAYQHAHPDSCATRTSLIALAEWHAAQRVARGEAASWSQPLWDVDPPNISGVASEPRQTWGLAGPVWGPDLAGSAGAVSTIECPHCHKQMPIVGPVERVRAFQQGGTIDPEAIAGGAVHPTTAAAIRRHFAGAGRILAGDERIRQAYAAGLADVPVLLLEEMRIALAAMAVHLASKTVAVDVDALSAEALTLAAAVRSLRRTMEGSEGGAVILGRDPADCDGIYPRTRDGRCQGCGLVGEHPERKQ